MASRGRWTGRVNPRARTHEDRAGDPLDGLVNLFDLGIVLAVAFLLAALSSLDLAGAIFNSEQGKVPEDTVVARKGERVRTIDLEPGARVVGRGEQVGTVYRLTDGRTVIVQGDGAGGDAAPDDSVESPPADGSGNGAGGDLDGGSSGGAATPDTGSAPDEPASAGAPDDTAP